MAAKTKVVAALNSDTATRVDVDLDARAGVGKWQTATVVRCSLLSVTQSSSPPSRDGIPATTDEHARFTHRLRRDENHEIKPSRLHSVLSAPLAVKSFYLALELDQKWLPFAIQSLACGHFYPAFADAIFFNVSALLVVKANADVVLENLRNMEGTASIDG